MDDEPLSRKLRRYFGALGWSSGASIYPPVSSDGLAVAAHEQKGILGDVVFPSQGGLCIFKNKVFTVTRDLEGSHRNHSEAEARVSGRGARAVF